MIFRSVNVATPLPFVVAVNVPAKSGEICRPDAEGDVANAAVTTTPAAAAPPDWRVTAGCVASSAPTCPFDGCVDTELDDVENDRTSWPSFVEFVYMLYVLLVPVPTFAPVPFHCDVVVATAKPL